MQESKKSVFAAVLIVVVALTMNLAMRVSAEGELWSQSGLNVYYNSGKVSVGTSSAVGIFNVASSSGGQILEVTSDGKVGIGGPTNYYSTLVVNGGMRTLYNNGDTLIKMHNSIDNGVLDIFRDNVEKIRLHANGNSFIDGNLGIGTTTPQKKFHVVGAGKFDANGNNDVILELGDSAISSSKFFIDQEAARTFTFSGVSSSDYLVKFKNSGTGSMILNVDGKVGVGTTTPQEKLDVFGNVKSSGNLMVAGGKIINTTGTSDPVMLGGSATDRYVGVQTYSTEGNVFTGAGKLNLRTYGKDGDRLVTLDGANGGKVGIGTTTPQEKLEVNGNIKLSGNIVSDGDICIGKCQ